MGEDSHLRDRMQQQDTDKLAKHTHVSWPKRLSGTRGQARIKQVRAVKCTQDMGDDSHLRDRRRRLPMDAVQGSDICRDPI